jgi:hypothetical protein
MEEGGAFVGRGAGHQIAIAERLDHRCGRRDGALRDLTGRRFTSARDAGIAAGILLRRRTAAASFPPTYPRHPAPLGRNVHDRSDYRRNRVYWAAAYPPSGAARRSVRDINPQTANFSELAKVKVLRGDVSQFDDVMAVMTAVKPDRVVNLAYYISSDLPPRVAFKLNILGMDNCFEAARLAGCNRVVYASSVAANRSRAHTGLVPTAQW